MLSLPLRSALTTLVMTVCVAVCLAVSIVGCGVPPGGLELQIIDGSTAEPTPENKRAETPQDTPEPTKEFTSPELTQPEPQQPDDAGTQDEAGPEPNTPEPQAPNDAGDAEDIGDAGVPELAPEPTPELTPEPPPDRSPPSVLPGFPHFDKVIDLHRGSDTTYASLIYIAPGSGKPQFRRISYGSSGAKVDFWPASTIKVYVATAALVLLKQYGVSLDATATFYYKNGSSWTKDTSRTFRSMIHDAITCSSNETYTLLLRFVGLDWLHKSFLTKQLGFANTAVMQGYVSARPYGYSRSVGQRIVMTEGSKRAERIHTWSGTKYANQVPCVVANSGGTANCSSTDDMAEHLRRIFFHEHLATQEQFSLRKADLDWYRYGSPGKPVLGSRCTKGGWDGIKKVLPGADYYHKPGTVSNYKSDMGYIDDAQSGTRYIFALAQKSSSTNRLIKLSEEVARMVLTPSVYVDLQPLRDNVNPVGASLTVYAERPAQLDLQTKPFSQDPKLPTGWTSLAGTSISVPRGISSHALNSACLSMSQKVHIRGRLQDTSLQIFGYSDLHFVVVDATVSCP